MMAEAKESSTRVLTNGSLNENHSNPVSVGLQDKHNNDHLLRVRAPVIDSSASRGRDEDSEIEKDIRTRMLARVALSDVHFKHQQRGDPDLTMDEKIEISQALLDSSKVKFLEKFWNYLELSDITYFERHRKVYEIDFYLKQVEKNKNECFQKNRLKNRRYEAMKELIAHGEYFSDEEMKFREPFLYEQMVGQYLTQKEIQGKVDKSDLTFSSILLKHIDQLDENVRFTADKDKEDGQAEEEEEECLENEETYLNGLGKGSCDKARMISEEHKQELKAEFLTIMQEKFLNGEDKAFDYRNVDYNDSYDDLDLVNADAEEKYFDEDDDL